MIAKRDREACGDEKEPNIVESSSYLEGPSFVIDQPTSARVLFDLREIVNRALISESISSVSTDDAMVLVMRLVQRRPRR